jgi:uncharacterized protein YxeA
MRKLTIPIILLCLFSITGLIYGITNNVRLVKSLDAKNYQLTQRSQLLEMTVIEQDKQIKDLQHTITGLNQANEQVTVKYVANELMVATLSDKYREALSYITMAEWILGKQNITYLYTGER